MTSVVEMEKDRWRKIEQIRNEKRLERERKKNNPNNKPAGAYTGRCPNCDSTDLWDDNLAWGCKNCDFFRSG